MRTRALAALGIAMAAACTFPAVGFFDGSADGGADRDAVADPTQLGDDAQPLSDAGSDARRFEAGADANACDLDDDGYRSKGDACGGLDCDDTDERANPGVDAALTFGASPPLQGDWDCSGRIDKTYDVNVSCAGLSLFSCGGTGFTNDPPCGGQGTLVTCGKIQSGLGGLFCGVASQRPETQGCR